MPCTLLDLATARVMPWKNGGGETLELAIAPAGAGLEDFAWRISCARVASSGPFSRFPGVDRSLALLAGESLTLQRAGAGSQRLRPGEAPLAFTGEESICAALDAGPVRDFNLMTRRDAWRHELQLLPLDGERTLENAAEVLLLWCQAGSNLGCQLPDGQHLRLDPDRGLLLEKETGRLTLRSAQPARLYVGRMYRR
ncbi:HutD family protein [Ectopseudomonas hydrolytica]|uniref:HutD family protein n=1 Tax=Ectopseudomonas hydrolytica TaxID=2493633 RepID=A0ABY5A620_9GAMM|nr:HutD family protein [Pseudomonas hydrolytica]USR39325.1 HutD family protein [Pseudomonas hydrolytica]